MPGLSDKDEKISPATHSRHSEYRCWMEAVRERWSQYSETTWIQQISPALPLYPVCSSVSVSRPPKNRQPRSEVKKIYSEAEFRIRIWISLNRLCFSSTECCSKKHQPDSGWMAYEQNGMAFITKKSDSFLTAILIRSRIQKEMEKER